MANLIIKPASASDSLKLQDGAGSDIVTVSTNKVDYGKGITEKHVAYTQGAAGVTLDLAAGNFFHFTLTENVTGWTFSNLAAAGAVSSWIIKIQQRASGTGFTVAYPSTVHWAGGTDHVMSTANNAVDIISMFHINHSGSNIIYANIVGKAFA